MKQIFISGITGKVGILLSSYILKDSDFDLVGGSCSPNNLFIQKDIGELLDTNEVGIKISDTIPEEVKPDVIIDFSSPEASMKVLKEAVARNIPILIGTTGFNSTQIEEIELSSKEIAILYAPNTSPGIAILKSLLNHAKKFFSKDNQFNISETHHSEKKDAPSGTALDLQKEIGLHDEIIELKHKAENRSIFALGALKGASWLTEKTAGLYAMTDIYSS